MSQDFNAEIENEIDFTGRYPRFTMLVPYLNDPNSVVAASIKSCNEVGIFLRNEAIISNVKELDDDEVNQVWHRIKQQRPPSPIQWQDRD